MGKKFSTGFEGVRYTFHRSRKHGAIKDKCFTIRYRRDGKQHEESVGWASQGMTEKRAFFIVQEIKSNIRMGKSPQSIKEMRETEARKREREKIKRLQETSFSDFFNNKYFPYAKDTKKSETVKSEFNWFKNHINPVIGNKPLYRVAPLDIERIKRNMSKKGLSPRSVQYALSVIRQVYYFAIRTGLYEGVNPVKRVKFPKADNKRVRFLTEEEAKSLLSELKDRSLDLYEMALLSLYCGLRAGEIFNLTWDCVKMETGKLLLKDTKSGKSRYAYMTSQVKDMLKRRYAIDKAGYVFKNRKGGKIRFVSGTFANSVNALGLNQGVKDTREKVVFHTLRHTFASWLVQKGEDLYTVKELLGHSTITMTERYSHLSPANMGTAIKKLNSISV